MTVSVIYPIQLPGPLTFMSENQFSSLQLQIPPGADPRFFIPPISGKQIRAALIDDFATNICTANVRGPVCTQHDRSRYCWPKSSHHSAQNMERPAPASLGIWSQ